MITVLVVDPSTQTRTRRPAPASCSETRARTTRIVLVRTGFLIRRLSILAREPILQVTSTASPPRVPPPSLVCAAVRARSATMAARSESPTGCTLDQAVLECALTECFLNSVGVSFVSVASATRRRRRVSEGAETRLQEVALKLLLAAIHSHPDGNLYENSRAINQRVVFSRFVRTKWWKRMHRDRNAYAPTGLMWNRRI